MFYLLAVRRVAILIPQFFFKNGVPVWRGTGYYYSRFRPTLLHTIIFLVFLSSLAHMLIMRMNYSRDAKRVAYFENTARALAGTAREPKTSAGQPVKRRRKVRVPMVEGNEGAGTLELVVEDGQVFFVSLHHEIATPALRPGQSELREYVNNCILIKSGWRRRRRAPLERRCQALHRPHVARRAYALAPSQRRRPTPSIRARQAPCVSSTI